MDLSKLPKLSDTKSAEGDAPPTAVPPPPVDVLPRSTARPAPVVGLAETWLSIGVGAFILLFWPRFLQWASSRLFHTAFNEFKLDDGTVIPYPHVPEFWGDLGPTLIGLVLILDGLLLFTRRRGLIGVAVGLTLISTVYNLAYVIYSFGTYGLAPVSLLAVIFGGFILMTQWAAYQSARVRVGPALAA